eukprot:3941117-Ditylum_brightwellii.AAC.1
MKRYGYQPDISTYHEVISAYLKVGKRHKDALRLLDKIENDVNVVPNSATYNLVIRCCGKDGAWEEASKVTQRSERGSLRNNDVNKTNVTFSATTAEESHYSDYFDVLNAFSKRGKAKDEYYHIGTYCRSSQKFYDVGIQPHRNPAQNGISLIFVDGVRKEKLGFMLLRHTSEDDYEGKQHSSKLFSAII